MATNNQKRPCRRSSRIRAKDEVKAQTLANLQSREIHLTYDVLRIIFHHLSYKDLRNVSRVSRSWAEAASLETQKRNEPVTFMEHCKILKQGLNPLLEKVWDIRIEPHISFFFLCRKTLYLHMKQPLVANAFRRTQKNSEVIVLHSAGVIMDNSEIQGRSKHMVCAFLPKMLNVDIRTFSIVVPSNVIKEGQIELFKALKQLPLLDEQRSTCLLLFCKDTVDVSFLLSNLNSYSNKISSLWGGLITNCYMYEKTKPVLKSSNCLGILITGHIKTWSTILEENCDTKEKVEEHLRLWKQHLQLRKHSIGYMFACHARGVHLYRKQHVESSIFKSLFPDVQLVGCFGYGEFGKYTVSDRSNIAQRGQKFGALWYTQYSTIFMILTYD